MRKTITTMTLIFLVLIGFSEASEGDGSKNQIVRQGIEVTFSVEPFSHKQLLEGEFATINFRVKDATLDTPIPALHPSAWIDLQKEPMGQKGESPLTCKEKIGLYLQGTLSYRPDVDLNSYFILSLNHDGTISVTDPIVRFSGITQLYTMIYLKKPGEDWVLSSDEKKLFVTMPKADQVAVADTETFKIVKEINAGRNPYRIALQPDGKYLWVGNDSPARSESGVTVIDSKDLRVVAQIPTGAGHHEMAFTDDSLYAFVTNGKEGTLSVVDVQTLQKVKDIETGENPVAIAFSPLSKSVYVAHERDGTVVALDGKRHEVVYRIQVGAGVKALRIAPGGRFGLAANPRDSVVRVFDTSNNQMIHTLKVGKEPDQIAFSTTHAYVRSIGSPEVAVVPLAALGKDETVPVVKISAGQNPPGDSAERSVADAIVPTPEPGHVLIANPADKTIYYYMEGMSGPMGSFRSYGGYVQRAVLVVDRSLRERERGVYSAKIRIPASGDYQVAFLLDSPRISHCFEFSAKPNPHLAKKDGNTPKIEFLTSERKVIAGNPFRLAFKIIDPANNEPVKGLKDVLVQTTLAPGTWNERTRAKEKGEGVYEVEGRVPRAGAYYVTFSCPSLRISTRQFPYLVIQATGDPSPKQTMGLQSTE